ncbi:MAG: glutaconyl-CoA decarboxylase subunit beta [Candidatus Epulonipiscium fishelsonii]|nr:MAG: glutaconyl-CoA decarboxylase subunit beta [Epulopiscium sp. AS2M-Bin002]
MFTQSITQFIADSGLAQLNFGYILMILIACVLLYLGIAKGFEPLLLVPIAFGMLMVNLPAVGITNPGMMNEVTGKMEPGGLLYYIGMGKDLGIYPPLVFIGVGAMTDFGPLIANPKSLLLGAAAQIGIFVAFLGALLLGFTPEQASAIGIIGGADGPTSIFVATKLAPDLLGAIAVSAYSYMALVPVIQPPIMKMFTSAENRKIKREQLRPVSATEKIVFPIIVTISVSLLLPSAGTLVGMLMFGNLLKEVAATNRLADVASNAMMSTITILLGLSVGASTSAEKFLSMQTLGILALGLFAFVIGTSTGVLFGNVMCKMTGGKVNPLIGAAGVSAVPMAARVVQKVGQKENPSNFLLMHAMGPNVAGVIGSAIAAGVVLSIYAH